MEVIRAWMMRALCLTATLMFIQIFVQSTPPQSQSFWMLIQPLLSVETFHCLITFDFVDRKIRS
jgi:hypothetical protein